MNKLGKIIIICLVTILIILSGCCKQTKQENTIHKKHQSINNLINSAVAIPEYDENHKLDNFHCSGFFVSPKLIVTARHCFIDMDKISTLKDNFNSSILASNLIKYILDEQIKLISESNIKILKYSHVFNDNESEAIDAKIIFIDNDMSLTYGFDNSDIAILQVSNEKDYSKSWLQISNKKPIISDKIMSLGMPANNPWYFTEGVISKIFIKDSMTDLIIGNITIIPGSSGAPIINENYELLGLISTVEVYNFAGNPQLINFASMISIEKYKNILINYMK